MRPTEHEAYLASLEAIGDPHRVTVERLLSSAEKTTEVWLEPWGDRILLAPGSHYDLVARGLWGDAGRRSPEDVLTVEWDGGALKVWAATYTESLRIFQGGVLVWEWEGRLTPIP